MKRDDTVEERFTSILKSIRNHKDKSQQDIAENVGEIRQTIYDIENNRKGIRLSSLRSLADAYELTTAQVILVVKYSHDPKAYLEEGADGVAEIVINDSSGEKVRPIES